MTEFFQDKQYIPGGIEKTLPENFVEYCIFLVDSETQFDSRRQLSRLEELRKTVLQLTAQLTKDYIWQRSSLELEVITDQGLAYLRGISDYGDAIEDEWLIVFILREFSKSHPAAWIRIADSDGEFLLVEAANVLPKWLSPEIDQYRVWINNGRLRVIPVNHSSLAPNLRLLTLTDAVSAIRKGADSLIHSEFIEAEAFYRLEKYPGQIQKSLHHSLVTIPRRLAHVLHQSPKAVAPAVECFYLRDRADVKPLFSKPGALRFPPRDLVTLSVRFTRVLFAQLRSQQFEPPAPWVDLVQHAKDKEKIRLEMGMKLACGFEMMLNAIDKTDSRQAREAAIIVEDLHEDGDSVLPSDIEINAWKDARRDDDESWMDIRYEDFEQELLGNRTGRHEESSTGFGDATTQADLRKIVSRFEAFLNDEKAGLDGAEVDEMDVDNDDDSDNGSIEEDDDEDKEVSFDEVEFSRMMREMMGLAPAGLGSTRDTVKTPPILGQAGSLRRADDVEDEPCLSEVQNLAAQLESELKEHGALRLDAPGSKTAPGTGNTRTAEGSSPGNPTNHDDDDYDENDEGDWEDKDVDIDYNLAKNLLESFKGQAGLPGPAGNILGMMGLQLPRDEDNGHTARGESI
ncbi:ecdysoneless-like protein [Colletotrichum truncatum]|uniref:Ecdysoneless-like protein n=1 Tax=Colletotrichum truncatum TaxID=5467 RepID=A0ACC3Z5R5_COLTU|nr:ecdysoneless-like protein [Colletotrichum truncatum]KAF6787274.1 ecdysoneless-like protein [Colletotrichum truncatum]